MNAVLRFLLEVTVFSTVIIAVLLLLRRVMGTRLSPALRCALWLILIARLCLPVTFASGVSLVVLPAPQAAVEPGSSPSRIINGESVKENDPAAIARNTGAPPALTPQTAHTANGQPPVGQQPADAADKTVTENGRSAIAALGWQEGLLLIWLVGAAISAALLARSALRMRRSLRAGQSPVTPRVRALMRECARQLGIKPLPVVVSTRAASPALTVALFPRVVLPLRAVRDMDEAALSFALRHEMTHYKRGDHLAALFAQALSAVYWFNPLLRFAWKKMAKDMESACDIAVAKRLSPKGRAGYAHAIIALSETGPRPRFVLGMALSPAGKSVERRLKELYAARPGKAGAKIAALATAAALAFCCFTTACYPQTAPPEEADAPSYTEARLEQMLTPTPTPSETPATVYEAPDRYTASYSEDEKWFLDFVAEVVVPEVAAFPVAQMETTPFTQEQVDAIVEELFGDAPLFLPDQPLTKPELEQIIADLEKERESVEGGGSSQFDGYDMTKAEKLTALDRQIEDYTGMLEEARDIKDPIPASAADYTKSGDHTLTVVGERKGGKYNLSIYENRFYLTALNLVADNGFTQPGYMQSVSSSRSGIYVSSQYRDKKEPDYKLTREQAVEQASAFVRAIGWENARPIFVLPADTHTSEPYVESLAVHFTVDHAGIPTPWAGDVGYLFELPTVRRIAVSLNDDGIIQVMCSGNSAVTGNLVENAELLPFGQVTQKAYEEMKNFYTSAADDWPSDITSYQFAVMRMELGYIQAPTNADKTQSKLTPVWILSGKTTYTSDKELLREDVLQNGGDEARVDELWEMYLQQKEAYETSTLPDATPLLILDAQTGERINFNGPWHMPNSPEQTV